MLETMTGEVKEKMRMNYLKKLKSMTAIFLSCFVVTAMVTIDVKAEEKNPSIQVPVTEVKADSKTGSFKFDIQTKSEELYAGMEFGVVCGKGAKITKVSYDKSVSNVGPKEANGLVWFGYFDGEDSFQGDMTVTVEGVCEKNVDSAIAIKDVKLYQIGESDYNTKKIDSDIIVHILGGGKKAETKLPKNPKMTDMNAGWLLLVCLVAGGGVATALIYKKKQEKNKQETKEKE